VRCIGVQVIFFEHLIHLVDNDGELVENHREGDDSRSQKIVELHEGVVLRAIEPCFDFAFKICLYALQGYVGVAGLVSENVHIHLGQTLGEGLKLQSGRGESWCS
jgi:hypothetical protein